MKKETSSKPQDVENRLVKKRKRCLTAVAAGSFFIAAAVFDVGCKLYNPSTKPEIRTYQRLADPADGDAYVNISKFLITDEIKKEETEYYWIHRGANSPETVRKVVEENENKTQRLVLEMDVRVVNDEVVVEHGQVEEVEKNGRKINVIFDPAELEFSVGEAPPTFEQVISEVASVSTPEKPIAVNIDMKDPRKFSKTAMEKMIKTLKKFNIAAIIQPEFKDILYKLRGIIFKITGQSGHPPAE